jgi:anti-anti-sigma regulatory factor
VDTLTISVEHIELRRPVTILHLRGRVDATSYLELIDRAQAVYAAETRHIILDLQRVTQLSSAGLMALHSIAVLFRGGTPPDPESGWAAFHAVADDLDRGIKSDVKLINPQPQVRQVLDMVGFSTYIAIHGDLEAALIDWKLLAAYTES